MKPISAPISSQANAESISNLQEALLFILRTPTLELSAEDAGALRQRVGEDRALGSFGHATEKLLRMFQARRQLPEAPSVDERCAEALNEVLRQFGAFETSNGAGVFVVSGRVLGGDKSPLEDAVVRAFHENDRASVRLGEDATDAEGRYTIRYQSLPGVGAIQLRVAVLSRDGTPITSSQPIAATPLEVVDLTAPLLRTPTAKRRIEGRVVYENGLPADELKLRFYRHEFGGAAPAMLKETAAGEAGLYALEYDASEKGNSFEIRALDAAGAEVALTRVIHGIGDEPVFYLNLAAPTSLKPLNTEFDRMPRGDRAARRRHAEAERRAGESAARTSRSSNASTGWDARLIALAAKAARVSAQPDVGVSQGVLYGLFRAGLPIRYTTARRRTCRRRGSSAGHGH